MSGFAKPLSKESPSSSNGQGSDNGQENGIDWNKFATAIRGESVSISTIEDRVDKLRELLDQEDLGPSRRLKVKRAIDVLKAKTQEKATTSRVKKLEDRIDELESRLEEKKRGGPSDRTRRSSMFAGMPAWVGPAAVGAGAVAGLSLLGSRLT